ncbi:MAG: glycosyltransferase family 4 protein [Hyphomicrobiales bacterium]|nr:glycosyltransferase family 4 protein [Hyphomicrobiales bacterium]
MKIAQVSPLIESVPPRLYGGTERIVSYLTEELVRMGHDVTMFASGDSTTAADLVSCANTALRLDANVKDQMPYYMTMIDKVRRMADEFDVIHFHIDYFQFPLFRDLGPKTVTTLHSRQDVSDLKTLYAAFPELPLVSISNAQRRTVANANFAGTVYHGLPMNLHAPNLNPKGDYVAFLGRVSEEKRLDRAIRIARAAGIPIRIAAKVDTNDREYYEQVIKPMLSLPGVEFIGEINDRQKPEFLGNARAMLFPIDWPEPFGIVMIESMACGTPVLAFRNGSVPEVIDDGMSGFIVDTEEEAVSLLHQTINLDRRQVRRRFEERFSSTRMAEDYVEIYKKLLSQEHQLPQRVSTVRPRMGRDQQRMN